MKTYPRNLILIATLSCLLSTVFAVVSSSTSWYQGCYNVKDIPRNGSVWSSSSRNLVECTRHCLLQSFNYSGLTNKEKCLCINETKDLTQVNGSNCNRNCSLTVPLFCGGSNEQHSFVSLYSSRGPYFINSSLRVVADQIVVNQTVTLDAAVYLSALVNFTKNASNSDLAKTVIFLWSVDGQHYKDEKKKANSVYIRSRLPYTFRNAGYHKIRVVFKNALSEIVEQITEMVIIPKPTRLQLYLVEVPYQQPSCIPSHQDLKSPVVAVFQGQSELFEASLSIGSNLSFTWYFSDTNTTHVQQLNSIYDLPGQLQDARSSKQAHIFHQLGVYTVSVSVENSFGKTSKNLTVVVDSEDLENLQFSLPANSSRYIEVNKSIRFLVSLETATRQDTVLVVNFGDGIVGTFSLDATNTSAISDCSEPVFLLKDYGESCQLFGEICYVYTKPGYFKPQILTKNNISSISQALNVQIVVHEKPTTTKIVSKNFIATNTQAFFIVISPLLTNVTFVSWSIKSENKVILNQTGFAQLMHVFSKKGHYEITAVFENSENSMEKAQKMVVIREAIGKVLLQQLTSYLLKVGECLTFYAEVLTGNQVTFLWNIAGEVYSTQGNLTSSRSYVFHTPGRYNISISAYNEVSNITKFLPQEVVVQQPIEFLELLLNEVLPHDSNVLLCVRVIRGSDVSLWWDFGTSWQNPDIVLRNESKLCVEHHFPYLGFVNITVMAVNEVSNVTETCEVLIEAPVTTIDLRILRPTAVGIPIIFSAKTNGVYSKMSHLLYYWEFSNGVRLQTARPSTEMSFASPGYEFVSVTAYNMVNCTSLKKYLRINLRPDKPWLKHSLTVPVQENLTFEIMGILDTSHIEAIVVTYNSGKSETVKIESSPISWTTSFNQFGLVEVSVDIQSNSTDTSHHLKSQLYVDEPLTELSIRGPTLVKALRNSTWEAIHSFGTSIVYVWSLLPKEGFHDEDDIYVTSSPRFSEYLSLSGTYILSLFAENGISQQTASLTIVIVCPVVDIVLDTTYGVDNHPVEISVQVHGGDDIGLNVTFGDGSSQHLTSDQLQQLPDYFLHPFHTDQGLPLHHIILKHLYSTPGSYPLQITVSNSMSLIMRNSTIVVEEAITGLTLVSNSSRIMSIDDTVTISSSVKTGRNISFEWKCYPSHAFMDVVSFERSSKLTVTFNVMGIEYEIWVLVSNPWMKEPLKKLMHFAPVKRIESVFLKPMNNVYCAASLNMPDASENHVLFQATSSGTNVTYEFDYGDGSPVDHVNGKSSEIGPYDEATSRHIFRQEGVYTIKVTATNYLGNMTTTMAKPFCVQCPPRNLHIESKDHYKFGDNITFKAILNSGTNVSFDWNFGDQNQLINAGTSVTHRYLTTGRKKVTLTARNKVGVIKRFTDVFGFHEITGVTLKDSGNLHKIAVRESVRFIAQILPDIPHTFKYLCWDFGFDDSEKMHTDFYIDTVYKSVGKYLITVEAVNPFSKATSAPLEVHVFSKIRSLQILIRSSRLLNQPIIFEAYTYSGSDLVYEWDFGDGSPIQTDCIVYHTYNKSDEYLVKLTVSNEISNSSITKRLFILNDTCLAPEVNILGSKNQIIQRSKDVHIEPVVSVNCTKRYVNYTWKIFNTTTGNLIKLEKIDNSVFHERILFLPRRTLHYGNYSIQLEVRMNGTIVYSKVEIHLQVIPSTLHGVIDGGVMRFISRFSDEIRLDGSKSEDPDCLTKDHLRYQWSCNQLNNKNTTCFHTGYKIPLNKSILTFPGSELTTDINDFEFTLNISVPGLHSIKTSQVLRAIKEHNILPIKLMCITCMNNVMNANEKLILETICDGCASDPSLFIYEWKVEIINNGNYNRYVHAHDYGKCVEANGSSYKLLVLPNTTLVTTTMSTTTTTTTAPPTTTTTMSRIDTMPHQKNLPQRRGPQRGRVSYNRDVSSIQRLQEGVHEMKGGHGRQIPDFGKTIPVEKGKKNHDTIITATVKTFEEHIVSKSRRKITLDPNDTLSAMNGPSLVVKPGVLSQGRDYLITVNVTKKGNGTAPVFYGIAMSHFLINESPSLGSCNIRPAAGIEMHTNFSVFCYEWKDEHQPLVYEVSYNLKKNQRKNLIYRGLNTLNATLKFMLPAGNAENGDKVFVYIAVMDSLGARTSVCYIPVTVQPIDQTLSSINVSVEKANKMLNDTLHGYLDEKDGRNARILVNLMAIRLNRLEPMDEAAKNKRWKRRHALLCVLDRLPVRDELETLQTVQAVEAVTLKSDELTLNSAHLALDILQSILNASQILYDNMGHQTENLLQLAIDSLSNIVVASSTSVDSSDFIVKSSDVANGFIKNELKFAAVEEKPIQHNSHVISIYAGRYSINYKPKLTIGQASFDLPEGLTKLVDPNSDLDGDDSELGGRQKCYQAQMTTFHKRPFSLGSMETNKVQSQVTSLKLYRCDGNVIIVDHLPKEDLITIGIPLEVDMDDTIGNHTLHRTHMNIHQFNVSKLNKDQSFHILVNLTPVYSGQLFPITISISDHRPEKTSKYIYSEKFDPQQNEVKIFLPSGELKNGTYYLSTVDATYNEGRPRPGVVTHRNYTLRLWWGQCLFWNKTDSKWSDSGCTDTSESTPEWTQCKCNHLTSFGSHFKPIITELSTIDVEHFIDLPVNLFPPLVCLFLTLLYGVLLYCCKKSDLHDAKKSGIVYLQDNLPTDRQKYEIVVETGFRKGAGTTAKISIILHGEYGISETRELISDEEKPLFERNSRDRFVLTLPDSIGKLLKLQLWHNNSGSSPCWYLSRVIITDVNLGQTYYFISERWFSVREDDGRVERELWAADNKIGFETILWAKGAQYIADYHLWSSVFTKPPHSRFTRVQRLTVCLSLLCIYMCLNATWYHVATKEYRGEFGLLDVSWQSIAVGILSCLATIPLNCFLVFLFRRRLIPYPGTEEDENYEDGKSEDPELSHTTHIEPVMIYSPTPTILTLQSLQEWASRKWKKQQREPLTISSDSPLPQSENSSKPPTPTLREPATQEKNETEEADQVSSGFEDFNSQYHRSQLSSDLLNMKNKMELESGQLSEQFNSNMGSQEAKLLQKLKPGACSVRECKRIFLPSWCSCLAWCLCILICLGTASLTIFFGIRFGYTKCIMWLQSFYFSIMTCAFLTHPLSILIITAINAYRYRMNPAIFDHYDDGYYGEKPEYRQKKQSICCEECKGFAARQRSRHLRFSRPPHRKQLRDSSKKSIQEKKSFSFFRNSTMLGLMVAMLCIMAFGKGSYSSFRLNDGLKTTLLRSGREPFLRINSLQSWWSWVQNSFLDHMYGETAYYKQPQNMEVNYVAGSSSYLIGKVHIRSVRQLTKKCQMSEYGWPQLCPNYNHTLDAWTVNNKTKEETNIVKLPHNRSKAAVKLMKIKEQNLINENIEQVIIEFTLYNPPTNLFSSVSLRLNLLGTGSAIPDAHISCTHLFRYITPWDKFILACELLFLVLMLFSLKNVFVDTIHYNKKLFKHAWKVLDMSICLASIIYIVCYVYRFVLVSEVIENLRSTFYQEFVDISFVTFWDEILKSQLGLVLCLSIFKFLSLSRYKTLFAMLENVYKRATTEIIIFAVFLLGVITAYTSLGYLAFGFLVGSFNNFWTGFVSMAALLTRNIEFSEVYSDKSLPGKLFIVAYLITGAGLFSAYILAILSSNHTCYKQKRIGALSLRESLIFVWQKLLTWTGWKSETFPATGDPSLPAEFTLAEIEYQVDELLFHMNALLGLSGMPEKPLYYLTDSDTSSDDRVGDDGISSGGSEMRGELHSDDRLEMRVQKIEENLCSKEPYLAPLIKGQTLDSEILTPEEEKELRSHLELKIFCRLQMQRQVHSGPCPYLDDLGIDSAATSTSGSPSVDRSPSSVSNSSHRQTHADYPNLNDIENQLDNPKPMGPASPLQANVGYGLDLPIMSAGKMKLPVPLSIDRSKPSPVAMKSRIEPTEKTSQKTSELPPKPTYKCAKVKEPKMLPNYNLTSVSGIRLLRHSGDSKKGLRRDNLESSSGSELDAVSHGRRLPGKRNLRKTKSRGKGKGGTASLVPAGIFEQLNLEMSATDDEISNTNGQSKTVDNSIQELEDVTVALMRSSPPTVLPGQPKEPTILEDDP